MNCEYCNQKIVVIYGSGRFCNKKCACAFSTKSNRQEISKKVSEKLKGRCTNPNGGFKKGYDPNRRMFGPKDWEKAVSAVSLKRENFYKIATWDELPQLEKRRRVIKEQNCKCLMCGLDSWLGKSLLLEIHHVDGNKKNNSRNNLQGLCLNCHGQTSNYRNRNRKETT